MINLGSNQRLSAPVAPVVSCKVVGVGGAGLRLLDALGDCPAELVAMHTDAQALMQSSAPRKLQIGRRLTRGLGSGGDPKAGESAALEQAEEIRAECQDAQIVMVCSGLGGGTGSGAASVVCREAAEAGALVLAAVTLPFSGEGEKRRAHAEEALSRLGSHCAAVLCFENNRLGEVAGPEAPLAEAIPAANTMLVTAVDAVLRLLSLPSLLHVGLDEIISLFRDTAGRCQFGHGVGQGEDRAISAVEQALQSPMLERGATLARSGNVLVHVSGDASLRFDEMQQILQEVSRRTDPSGQVFLGVAVDPSVTDEVRVSILASLHASAEPATGAIADGEEVLEPDLMGIKSAASSEKRVDRRSRTDQEEQVELPLDQAVKGRFKDLVPTLVEGQDLDIPTYIRMRLPLK